MHILFQSTAFIRHTTIAATFALLSAFSGLASAYGEEASISPLPTVNHERTNFDVVMYSSTTCGYCTKAREWFNELDIEFVEYFIDQDADAAKRHSRLGMTVTPTIIVGDSVIKGFRPQILEELVFEQLVFD